MIGNKIADLVNKSSNSNVAKVSKTSPENSSETAENETKKIHDLIKKISKKRYISPKEIQKIINDLRFI